LHYTACLANYLQRRHQGLDVRIVKHRDWRIELADMERAVDRKTRLIAISLVSSVNGHVENVKALSQLAHAHGGYLFADIIQAVGAVPVDVKAMGIDFASTGMYKWLQGEHGFGFLYIREDLAGSVVKPRTFTGGVQFHYPPWVAEEQRQRPEISVRSPSGVAAFECGTPSVITYAAQYESFQYIERLGIANIQAHARVLTTRLRKELSALGLRPITPEDAESPIVTFLAKDIEAVKRKIEAASRSGRAPISITGPNAALTVGRFGNQVRFSVSVFNNQQDVDTVLDVLS
jgi:selenocysteine lyase/cysteine desulfurase